VKGTRHTEEQIIAILKQGEAGVATTEICRQYGIREQTFDRWKAKYGGMATGEAKRLKQPIQPVNLFVIHVGPFTRQHHRQPQVPEPHPLCASSRSRWRRSMSLCALSSRFAW
jgi:hypothetical protein